MSFLPEGRPQGHRGAYQCTMYKLQAAVRECDRRLCQWCGVNVRRLPIQPLIHSRGRSLPKVFLGYVWVWDGRPLLSGHLRLDRQTLVITKYSGLVPIWPPNHTHDHLVRSGCWGRVARMICCHDKNGSQLEDNKVLGD